MSAINYDLNKVRGLVFDIDGVLSPSTVPTNIDGVPQRMVNVKDGYALQLAVKYGFKIAIVSGAVNRSVMTRYEGLGITDVFTGVARKRQIVQSWMTDSGLAQEEVAYVGDDVPDYEAMMSVGLKVAPADAATDIKGIADYISPVSGGYGVARDLIEQILRAKGMWMKDEDAFGW